VIVVAVAVVVVAVVAADVGIVVAVDVVHQENLQMKFLLNCPYFSWIMHQ